VARLFRRGGIWYAWVPVRGGGTRKVSTQCTDKRAAEKRAAELEREAVDPAAGKAARVTVEEMANEYIESRARRGRAQGTLHHYTVKLSNVVALMPARLADVDAEVCERYITQRRRKVQQTTIKKELRALKAVLVHARRLDLYARDPDAVIPELEETYRPRTRVLGHLELVALVNALPEARAAHAVFIVATGARWSESMRVQSGDVEGYRAFLRGTKTLVARRHVPVPPVLRGALAWALARLPLPVPRWTNVRRDLAAACASAGIPPVTPNDLRRTFGSWLRAWGVTPDLIGAAMGHTTSRMVERVYGRLSPADLGALIEARTTGLLMGGEPAKTSQSGTTGDTDDASKPR
jgi:integrase